VVYQVAGTPVKTSAAIIPEGNGYVMLYGYDWEGGTPGDWDTIMIDMLEFAPAQCPPTMSPTRSPTTISPTFMPSFSPSTSPTLLCDDFEYFFPSDPFCFPCDDTVRCQRCVGPDITDCINCVDSYFVDGGSCSFCSSGCKTCQDSSNCTTCLNGFEKKNPTDLLCSRESTDDGADDEIALGDIKFSKQETYIVGGSVGGAIFLLCCVCCMSKKNEEEDEPEEDRLRREHMMMEMAEQGIGTGETTSGGKKKPKTIRLGQSNALQPHSSSKPPVQSNIGYKKPVPGLEPLPGIDQGGDEHSQPHNQLVRQIYAKFIKEIGGYDQIFTERVKKASAGLCTAQELDELMDEVQEYMAKVGKFQTQLNSIKGARSHTSQSHEDRLKLRVMLMNTANILETYLSRVRRARPTN